MDEKVGGQVAANFCYLPQGVGKDLDAVVERIFFVAAQVRRGSLTKQFLRSVGCSLGESHGGAQIGIEAAAGAGEKDVQAQGAASQGQRRP